MAGFLLLRYMYVRSFMFRMHHFEMTRETAIQTETSRNEQCANDATNMQHDHNDHIHRKLPLSLLSYFD